MKFIKLSLIALLTIGFLAPQNVEAKNNKAAKVVIGDTVGYTAEGKTLTQIDVVTLTESNTKEFDGRIINVELAGDIPIVTTLSKGVSTLYSLAVEDLSTTGTLEVDTPKPDKKPKGKKGDKEDKEEKDPDEKKGSEDKDDSEES